MPQTRRETCAVQGVRRRVRRGVQEDGRLIRLQQSGRLFLPSVGKAERNGQGAWFLGFDVRLHLRQIADEVIE